MLLQVEPCGWTVFEDPPHSGRWMVSFDIRIDLFRGVADLQDYWTRMPWNRVRRDEAFSAVSEMFDDSLVENATREFERLARMLYAELRDGNLRSETAFDFAWLLLEHGYSALSIRELADQSAAGADSKVVARLARQVLDIIRFEPDFQLEPVLFVQLEHALEIVNADLRTTGMWGRVRLVVTDGVMPPHAQVEFRGVSASSTGIAPGSGSATSAALVAVAEDLQAAVMEARYAVWPVCYHHQLVHMHADIAMQQCGGVMAAVAM